MRNLLPYFIQEQFEAGHRHGGFEAYTLFVDMSGFTHLTEVLLRQGTAGAERLSDILNAIFEPMVELVYAQGGFIPHFAGDAFTGIFPTEKCHCEATEILALGQRLFGLLEEASVHFEDFQIGIKTGLSFGNVHWGIVGGERLSFYFRGQAIEGCADGQSLAKQHEIIVDEAFRQKLPGTVKLRALETQGFFSVEDKPLKAQMELLLGNKKVFVQPALEQAVVERFLPEAVINFNGRGEFRTVVSVFISFEGVDDYDTLNRFSTAVLDHLHSFSGYFKEIEFGDKGGVAFGIFGAPVTFENNVERALEFVCALQDDLAAKKLDTSVRYKIGIAQGIAYTGMVGGEERSQYAAVGNRVNIAARLMIKADWGQVLVDGEVQKNRHFRFQHKGDLKYKGLETNTPTFLLLGRNREQRRTFEGMMVGRGRELDAITNFAMEAFEQSLVHIAYVYGEPGIGKTRLSFELRNQLRKRGRPTWFSCQSDQILQKPFNPFVYFLKDYFEQFSDNTSEENLENFEREFSALLNEIMDIKHPEAEGIKREIIRTKPVLAALTGLKTTNSLWENLDAKGRYLNTLAALTAIFQAEALLGPVVIELEDGHWFDENSLEFLNDFAWRIKNYPVFILVTSRYDDEGVKPRVFDNAILEKYGIPQVEVDLNILDAQAMHDFAEGRLHGEIHPNLLELLLRTTNGNPFYAEQMLEYFVESDQLRQEKGGWTVKDSNVRLSDSIHSVLTARIDRLSSLVKETIKAAAVIGREFELPVLSEVMKESEALRQLNGNASAVLKEQVQTAERAQIWQAMNELRYIFRHSLLREAVYDMQLKVRLRELHRLIAEAVETIYAGNLEQRYVDLVFHYELAEVEDKLQEYLQKAADHAKEHYQNQQAIQFYNKLLKLLKKQANPTEMANTLLKKGSILELIGKWEDAESNYRQALELARQTADSQLLGRANNNVGYLLMLKGKYDEADTFLETAAAFFGSSHDNRGTSKVYGNLGTLYFRQGKYEDAKLYFIRSIQLAQLYKHTPSNAQIVATLGLTYMNLGKYDDGIRWQQSQLDICKQVNDKQGMATLYTNMGIVYFEKGEYDDALACYQKGLALSEELGNKQLVSIAIGCIGNVWQRKGKFDLAMEHFEKDLDLVEELGDKQGISIALGLIGELNSITGQFNKAIGYMERNLAIAEELGYRKGVAKSLNTLGDIHYYKKDYQASLDYYDRSIAVTRSIGNKLVLGFCLVEKGNVLLATGQEKKAQTCLKDALGIVAELNHPDLTFEAKLLSAKIAIQKKETENAKNILQDLLSQSPSKREMAELYYQLSKIDGEFQHRDSALILYTELYKKSPIYLYKIRLEELSSAD